MYNQAFENLRKTAEAVAETQQELFQKWVGLFPGVPVSPSAFKEPLQFPKKVAEIFGELITKQSASLRSQFSAGLRTMEEAVRLAEAKDPEELRTKSCALWEFSVACLRDASEAQLHNFQTAVTRCGELITKAPVGPPA